MSKTLNRFILLIGFFWLSFASAFTVPALTGPVVDQAQFFSANENIQLANRLQSIKVQSGNQIQVLIVDSLEGEAIEQVAIQTFDQWKLGDEKKDNGVLFLISLRDRKLRIEVGQGLEGQIPDIIAKRIISEITRPLFKSDNYFAGVFFTIEAINQAATTPEGQIFDVLSFKTQILSNSNNLLKSQDRKSLNQIQGDEKNKNKISSAKIFAVLGILWLIIFIFSPSTALWILFTLLSGGRNGRSGGGGWSGGGGSSSGGGASGDW